jgi:hypothetical protein
LVEGVAGLVVDVPRDTKDGIGVRPRAQGLLRGLLRAYPAGLKNNKRTFFFFFFFFFSPPSEPSHEFNLPPPNSTHLQ